MSYRKKLIEVSLPLEAINAESAREKSIRHGHPSTLHLWWARRPLAACRAVLFSSLVDDPSEYMPDEESANAERERLFELLEELVKWENIQNEELFDKARLEIARSVARDLGVDVPVGKEAIRKFLAEKAPPVLDPFAGGGSIPLEAQRLGLRAYASDLNPVAVLINKALIEIPPKFAGMPPVHPEEINKAGAEKKCGKKKGEQLGLWQRQWKGAEGLAEDVRYYGKWMRDEAEKRIGHLYPKYKITAELLAEREDLRQQGLKPGDELTVIAWLWARTVKCPNPACGSEVPFLRTFWLSTRKGTEAWIEPQIQKNSGRIYFKVHIGTPTGYLLNIVEKGTKLGRGGNFSCLVCKSTTNSDYVRSQGEQNRLGEKLIAVALEGKRGRVYLPLQEAQINCYRPEIDELTEICQELADDPRAITVKLYGYKTFDSIFNNRQLTSLVLFSDLLSNVHRFVLESSGGNYDYANAIVTYLSFALDKGANYWSTLCGWHFGREIMMSTLGRNALPMIWDYAEANPFSNSSGNWMGGVDQAVEVLQKLPLETSAGYVYQCDASSELPKDKVPIVSTDPPYYDNVPYSDISDYFYVWLRRSLRNHFPDLFRTVLTPKSDEVVAFAYRFQGSKAEAEKHFETKLGMTFSNIRKSVIENYPVTIYYAFKQQETKSDKDISSTGWEKMLEGLSKEFQIIGTWPMRTEQSGGLREVGRNSLASSIVLVCRSRERNEIINRRDFLAALKKEMPLALHQLQKGNIAPVDLAQAAIGPGMAIFSRYMQVLEADGTPMRVRATLSLINQALDEYLTEQEGEYDSDTRWALSWFEQYGHETGPYGVAETLSKAKNTSVEGLVEAGFLEARGGKVRLLRRDELNPDYDPSKDKRPTAWEAVQYLIRILDKDGEAGAGTFLARLGALGETARDLAYRLYTVCERKGWAQEALAYNMLVVAWPRIKEQAGKQARQERLL